MWFTKKNPNYFMPYGLLLQILGVLYMLTSVFICSDTAIVVLTRGNLPKAEELLTQLAIESARVACVALGRKMNPVTATVRFRRSNSRTQYSAREPGLSELRGNQPASQMYRTISSAATRYSSPFTSRARPLRTLMTTYAITPKLTPLAIENVSGIPIRVRNTGTAIV